MEAFPSTPFGGTCGVGMILASFNDMLEDPASLLSFMDHAQIWLGDFAARHPAPHGFLALMKEKQDDLAVVYARHYAISPEDDIFDLDRLARDLGTWKPIVDRVREIQAERAASISNCEAFHA